MCNATPRIQRVDNALPIKGLPANLNSAQLRIIPISSSSISVTEPIYGQTGTPFKENLPGRG